MSKRFSKKNAQKYVVVHRPHDDPQFYDEGASAHVLVPVGERGKTSEPASLSEPTSRGIRKEKVGEAALYGINFDDSAYDYTQHLKPIGEDPSNAVFIPAKQSNAGPDKPKKKNIEDLFVEPSYQETEIVTPVFQRGVAKPEYLIHQQDVPDDIKGFKPDMNPALREVLEALEDEAYVVNDDIVVEESKINEAEIAKDDEDDLFAQLLGSGEAENEEQFEEELDEWDIDNLGDYEDEHYREELENIDNVENLEDLRDINYQADVKRFQFEQKHLNGKDDSDDEFDNESIQPDLEIENDELGDLPTFDSKAKTGSKKRKDRKKKGAMSDISGFSMSSSAIARTETMTILDDKYDHIISGYENYKEEQEEDIENNYQLFDMSKERSDFESLLDDFLDNYELEKGGRKLTKKSEEQERLKLAADEVSKGKLSQRRNRERLAKQKEEGVGKVANSLSNLKL